MKRTLALVAAAVALVVVAPAPASAAVDAVGFFTRNPAASPPAGTFQVANAPDGVVSFGAIRAAEAGDTISQAFLMLQESGQQVNNTSAVLQVCPALGTFKAGKGTLAEGPKADCLAKKVEIKRSGNGMWEADVTSLLAGSDSPAVAVVPVSGVFQVSFGPPELIVETEGSGSGADGGLQSDFDASEFGGSGGGSSSGSDSSGSSEPSGSSGSSSDFGGSGSEVVGGSSFDAGGSGSSFGSPGFSGGVPAPTAAPVAPAPSSAAPELAAAPPVDPGLPTRRRLSATTASASSEGGSWGQFLFFVIAAGVIGAGAGIARNRLVTSRAA